MGLFTGVRTDSNKDSVRAAAFELSIPGVDTATFRKVTGLSSKHEVVTEVKSSSGGKVTVLKQPGRFVLGEITFERGFTDSMELWEWRQDIIDGKIQSSRKDCTISLFNHEGDQVVEYEREKYATRSDFKIKKRLQAASGDTIAVEWQGSFVDKESGKLVEVHGAEFWKMRNGRLIEWRAYSNQYSDP